MSDEYELQDVLWGALKFQYEWGRALCSEQRPHATFSPLPLFCASVDKLWESVLVGGVNREASRYHFIACTYSAIRGLDRLEPIAGDPLRVLSGVLDHQLDWYDEMGLGGLKLTRQVGCVVGLLTASQSLQGLQQGSKSELAGERELWLNALLPSVGGELLYSEKAKTQISAPIRQTTSLTAKGHPSSKRGGVPKVTALGQNRP